MAFLNDNAMPDAAAIQAENEKIFMAMQETERKEHDITAIRQELRETVETLPIKIGVGGAAVIFAVYWFLIRR